MGFEVYTVDWTKNPSGDKKLTAEFRRSAGKDRQITMVLDHTPVYTPVSAVTSPPADGKAAFLVPPTAGT
jgi:hypothetical protein